MHLSVFHKNLRSSLGRGGSELWITLYVAHISRMKDRSYQNIETHMKIIAHPIWHPLRWKRINRILNRNGAIKTWPATCHQHLQQHYCRNINTHCFTSVCLDCSTKFLYVDFKSMLCSSGWSDEDAWMHGDLKS